MNERVEIPVLRLPGNDDIPLPAYQTVGSAGMDLAAAVPQPVTLPPGKVAAIPCGLMLGIPVGFEGQIRSRSGLALKHSVTVANSPGTIDSDYRGEILVLLINLGSKDFAITRGMRIAQLVIAPVIQAKLAEVQTLPPTDRGAGGFGHTGQ